MTTYDWPSDQALQAISGTFRLSNISALSSSPYTGAHKAASLGQLWVASLTFSIFELAEVHLMQGFLDMLEGPVNPVRIYDRWRPFPKALHGGVSAFSDGSLFSDGTGWTDGYGPILLAAVAQGANVITMEDLPVSTECFRRGDLIGIGGYLYEIKIGVTANSSGQAAVTIQPGLRAGAAIGDPVTLYRPTVPMRLASDADAAINRSGNHGEPFNLTFVEDIP